MQEPLTPWAPRGPRARVTARSREAWRAWGLGPRAPPTAQGHPLSPCSPGDLPPQPTSPPSSNPPTQPVLLSRHHLRIRWGQVGLAPWSWSAAPTGGSEPGVRKDRTALEGSQCRPPGHRTGWGAAGPVLACPRDLVPSGSCIPRVWAAEGPPHLPACCHIHQPERSCPQKVPGAPSPRPMALMGGDGTLLRVLGCPPCSWDCTSGLPLSYWPPKKRVFAGFCELRMAAITPEGEVRVGRGGWASAGVPKPPDGSLLATAGTAGPGG